MSLPLSSALMISPHRVSAMVLRYLYLLRSSWSRVLELIYWPAVQLLVWGFLQFYIAQNSGFFARAGGAARPCCSPPTTWPRSSGCASVSSS